MDILPIPNGILVFVLAVLGALEGQIEVNLRFTSKVYAYRI